MAINILLSFTATPNTQEVALPTVQVQGFNFAYENPVTIGTTSSGTGAGRIKFMPLTVSKPIDSTTPQYLQACALGRPYTHATLTFQKAGGPSGANAVFLTITLSDVFLTQDTLSGNPNGGVTSSADGITPTEVLTLVYGGLQITYSGQDPNSGRPLTPVQSQWNQISNQPSLDYQGG